MSGHPSEKSSDITLEKSEVEQVLGMSWDPNTASFHLEKLNFSKKPKNVQVCLKPNVRSSNTFTVNKAYGIIDLLVLLAPFTIEDKVLMHKLWLEKCDWDTSYGRNEK